MTLRQTQGETRHRRSPRPDLIVPLVAALIVLCASVVNAHPVPFSYLDLHAGRDAIDGTLVAHIFDVGHDLNVDPPERLLDAPYLGQRSRDVIALLAPRVSVTADGRLLAAVWSNVEPLPDRQSIRLHVRFALASPPGTLTVTANMFPYDPNHQTFLNLYEGDALTQAILDAGHAGFTYFAGTRQGALAIMRKFVPAGVQHILIGPDHLLFLLGLLLLGGTLRRFVLVVTAFTLAHTVTLALAAFNLVTPPAHLIEPGIALSIVYMGADNLLIRDGRDVRAWIAATFGFIHGFGFANVLRGMGLPARALGWSIFSFNVGIELGQLVVVVGAATALAALRARSEAAGRQLAVVGSIVVIAAGAFWFVQRVFFPGGIS